MFLMEKTALSNSNVNKNHCDNRMHMRIYENTKILTCSKSNQCLKDIFTYGP